VVEGNAFGIGGGTGLQQKVFELKAVVVPQSQGEVLQQVELRSLLALHVPRYFIVGVATSRIFPDSLLAKNIAHFFFVFVIERSE